MLSSTVVPGDVAVQRRRPLLFSIRTSRHFIFATAAIGLFTSTFVHSILFPLSPFIVARVKYGAENMDKIGNDTSTSQETGILVAIYAIGLIVGSPIFGWLGDRIKQRRLPMLLGISLSASANFLFMFSSTYWMLLLARLFQGIANACVWTMCLCLIADNWPLEQLGLQMGKVVGFYPLGMICGLPAGVLYSKLGYASPFIASMALSGVDFFMRLVMIERSTVPKEWLEESEHPEKKKPTKSTDSNDGDGDGDSDDEKSLKQKKSSKTDIPVTTWELLKIPRLWASLFLMTLVAAAMSAFEPTLSMRMAAEWNFDALQCSLILIAYVLPSIGASVFAGHLCDRFGTKIVALLSLLLAIPSIITMGLPDHRISYWVLVPILICGGITLAGCQAPVFPEIAQIIVQSKIDKAGDESTYDRSKILADRHGLGRSYAMANAAYAIGMGVGPILAGFLYGTVGFFWMCFAISCCFIICIPVAVIFIGGRGKWIVRKVSPRIIP